LIKKNIRFLFKYLVTILRSPNFVSFNKLPESEFVPRCC